MSVKGFPSTKLFTTDSTSQFATLQPEGSQRVGLDVVPRGVFEVATDAAENTSTSETRSISATAHVARVGDLIRFTSGANNGIEITVGAVATNSITLSGSVASISSGDTFGIMRYVTPRYDSSGAQPILLTTAPLEILVDGVATQVDYDTGTPANSVPVPVYITGGGSGSGALDYGASAAAARTAAQIGNATGAADFNAGNASAQTLRTVIATDQSPIPVTPGSLAAVGLASLNFSSTPVTSSAYVQLIASSPVASKVQIFMSSGEPLYLAFGAPASEVDQIFVIPGGNGVIDLEIPAATRVSLKAVSTTASTGLILVNLFG